MQLLLMVDRKRKRRDVLLEACKLLSSDRQSYWPEIHERIKQSKCMCMTHEDINCTYIYYAEMFKTQHHHNEWKANHENKVVHCECMQL